MTTIPSPVGYSLDPTWHAERDRLSSLTDLYDPPTLQLCDRLGLSPGWQCLDIGAGTGSLAVELAARVGPSGTVVALDIDTRFLAPLTAANLHVVQADLTAQPLPTARYDLVHARLVLEHLPQRQQILQSMAAALKPGGWLLVEDFDWATAALVDPPSQLHTRVVEACKSLFAAHGYDPYYGRTLPRLLRNLGLTETGTHAESKQVRADAQLGVPQWELLADQLRPGLIASGLLSEADLERFHHLWHDGDSICFAPLLVSSWGRRPPNEPAP